MLQLRQALLKSKVAKEEDLRRIQIQEKLEKDKRLRAESKRRWKAAMAVFHPKLRDAIKDAQSETGGEFPELVMVEAWAELMREEKTQQVVAWEWLRRAMKVIRDEGNDDSQEA